EADRPDDRIGDCPLGGLPRCSVARAVGSSLTSEALAGLLYLTRASWSLVPGDARGVTGPRVRPLAVGSGRNRAGPVVPLTRRMDLYRYGRMRALGGRLKRVRHGGSGARWCRYRRPNSLVFALEDEKPEQSRNDQKSTHHQEDKTCIAVEKPGEERVSDDVGLFAIEQIDAEPRQHVGNGNQGGATTEGCTEHASARTWMVVERQPDAIADRTGCNDEQGDGDREPGAALGE